ncbi:MAG: hypothetical protein M1820_005247 [Bogoriella megaspora]|nr:MAG: hypothetical protein M1820_005247 [Bogoriella megaspora]
MAAETPDSELREAKQYWGGYLVKQDKCGTDMLNRLLRGIANHISSNIQPNAESSDLTPIQLAEFYRSVGGDYDVLFIDTIPSSIAFIYKALGCRHSLQPDDRVEAYNDPELPALKAQGFVTWQTIQLLLGPEEHVPFLQNAIRNFDIKDPETGNTFAKVLPRECLPSKPDEEMLSWYDNVSQKLRAEAESQPDPEQLMDGRTISPEPMHTHVHFQGPVGHLGRQESYSSAAEDESRHGAAKYFSNPLYRGQSGRPAIVRRFSRDPPRSPPAHHPQRSPRDRVLESGKTVARTVRSTFSPHLWTPRHSHDYSHDRDHRHPRQASGSGEHIEEVGPHGGTPPGRHPPRVAPVTNTQSQPSNRAPYQRRPSAQSPSDSSSASDGSESSDWDSDVDPRDPRARPPPNRPSSSNRPSSEYPQRRTDSHRDQRDSLHPPLHHRRSHSPPSSPREYFPQYEEQRRNSSAQPPGSSVSPQDRRRHSATSPNYFPPMPSSSSRASAISPGSGIGTSSTAAAASAGLAAGLAAAQGVSPGQSPLSYTDHERERPSRPDAGLGIYNSSQRPPPPPGPPPPSSSSGLGTTPPQTAAQNLASHEFGPSVSPLFATQVAHMQSPSPSSSVVGSPAPNSAGSGNGTPDSANINRTSSRRAPQGSGSMGPPPVPRTGGIYPGRSGSGIARGGEGRASIDSAIREIPNQGNMEGGQYRPPSSRGGGRWDRGEYGGRRGDPRDRDGRDERRGDRDGRDSREYRREDGRESMMRYVSPPVNGVGGRRYARDGY